MTIINICKLSYVYPTSFEISEASIEPVKIYIQPTVPILCTQESPGKTCQLVVQIQHNEKMYLAPSACRLNFTKDNWNETQSLILKPLPNLISVEKNPLKIVVKLVKRVDDDASIIPQQWFTYEPEPITVIMTSLANFAL